MKKLFSMAAAAMAAIFALTAVSCDREPDEQTIKPHDPNDVSGVYGVNYEVFVDDATGKETERGVGRFQCTGVPLASVEVRDDGEHSRIVFNPYHGKIRFIAPNDGEELDIRSMLDMVKDEAGNYRFETTGLYRQIQREVHMSGNPEIAAYVSVAASGTIVRRGEKRDWVSTPAHITPAEETADMYYDLDMTVELTPIFPDGDPLFSGDDFERIVIKISSH